MNDLLAHSEGVGIQASAASHRGPTLGCRQKYNGHWDTDSIPSLRALRPARILLAVVR